MPASDLPAAENVEVLWDPMNRRLWVNTEQGNICRVYNVGNFIYRVLGKTDAETENKK